MYEPYLIIKAITNANVTLENMHTYIPHNNHLSQGPQHPPVA